MPLSPSGCIVDKKLAVDGHNEVDARCRRCSHVLALSARRCHIIDSGLFLRVGRQQQEEGIEVWCCCNISHHQQRRRHCIEQVQKQASEGGYMVTIRSLRKVVQM